jgi:hypothetical protein
MKLAFWKRLGIVWNLRIDKNIMGYRLDCDQLMQSS